MPVAEVDRPAQVIRSDEVMGTLVWRRARKGAKCVAPECPVVSIAPGQEYWWVIGRGAHHPHCLNRERDRRRSEQ